MLMSEIVCKSELVCEWIDDYSVSYKYYINWKAAYSEPRQDTVPVALEEMM
jgi:hypothetical protein